MSETYQAAAIVLAAGASSRLGEPKQLVRLTDSETLLGRAVRVAASAGCAPVVVVLGAHAEQIQAACDLGGAVVVVNRDWAEGMGSSLALAASHLPASARAVVVLTCDQPAVTSAHLRRLVADTESWGGPVCSSYPDRSGDTARGVPACFPAALFDRLRALRGDSGARGLLGDARAIGLLDGELDIDTPHALEEARRRLR